MKTRVRCVSSPPVHGTGAGGIPSSTGRRNLSPAPPYPPIHSPTTQTHFIYPEGTLLLMLLVVWVRGFTYFETLIKGWMKLCMLDFMFRRFLNTWYFRNYRSCAPPKLFELAEDPLPPARSSPSPGPTGKGQFCSELIHICEMRLESIFWARKVVLLAESSDHYNFLF